MALSDDDRRRIEREIRRNNETYSSIAQRGWDAFKRFIKKALEYISIETIWEFFKTYVLGM